MDASTRRILGYEARACGVSVRSLIDKALREFAQDRLKAALWRSRYEIAEPDDADARSFATTGQRALEIVVGGARRTMPAHACCSQLQPISVRALFISDP